MGAIGCITKANVFSITISEPLRLIKRIHVAVLFFCFYLITETKKVIISHDKITVLVVYNTVYLELYNLFIKMSNSTYNRSEIDYK